MVYGSDFIVSYGRASSLSQEKKNQKFLVNVGPAHPCLVETEDPVLGDVSFDFYITSIVCLIKRCLASPTCHETGNLCSVSYINA